MTRAEAVLEIFTGQTSGTSPSEWNIEPNRVSYTFNSTKDEYYVEVYFHHNTKMLEPAFSVNNKFSRGYTLGSPEEKRHSFIMLVSIMSAMIHYLISHYPRDIRYILLSPFDDDAKRFNMYQHFAQRLASRYNGKVFRKEDDQYVVELPSRG